MKLICVDDEPLAVEYTLKQCVQLTEISEAKGFTETQAALDWVSTHSTDIALLDINMPGIDGLTLAARIKQEQPKAAILFLTAYKEYAFDAYAVHPAGYLLKPVSLEDLAKEIRFIAGTVQPRTEPHIRIKTFGYFDVYVDGRPVSFKLAKAKEILAFLVDKCGAGLTRVELFAGIWGDLMYDRKMQKQLDVYIRSLRETLREYAIPEILKMERGILRVDPDTFTCDAYLFYAGDSNMINAYRGEYMSAYSWASVTEGILFWRTTKRAND